MRVMRLTLEQKLENRRNNLRRWRDKNREHFNKLQLIHSKKYQNWNTISKQWCRKISPDLFI